MRVIAGSARGRRLKSVAGMQTRPTTDRIKETLFNIISPEVPGSDFLDLFAGNGGIGIEALSRGANSATFIDHAYQCTKTIKANLELTKLYGEVYTNDVLKALTILAAKGRHFDIIFLDPPYAKGLTDKTLQQLSEYQVLNPQGLIIAEYGSKEEIAESVLNLERIRNERYGDTALGFYRFKGDIS